MEKKREHVLSGRNIYYDKHNRAIYYVKKDSIGYVIPKDLEGRFQALLHRYVIAIIACIMLEFFFVHNPFISIPFGIAVILYLEFSYRKTLKGFTQLNSFTPTNAISAREKMMTMSSANLFLRASLYFLVSTLLIANLFVTPKLLDDLLSVILSILFSIGALAMTINFLLILYKKRK